MNIVVIGSGRLGQRHLNIWRNMNDVNIVGIIARNKERLEKLANEYQTKAFYSIHEAVQNTRVDLFDICTPTYTHVPLIKEAARAKKHIICEKPLSLTTEEGRDALSICEKNNVQLLIGHTLRFFPQYAKARKMILKGKIGRSGIIKIERGATRPLTDWYNDYAKSGGLLLDLGIHDLDWLLWTFGEVQEVMAQEVKNENNQITYSMGTLKFTNGFMANLRLSWEVEQFYSSFKVAGSSGEITFDTRKGKNLNITTYHSSKNNNGDFQSISKKEESKNPFEKQLQHFIYCIQGIEPPKISPLEALQAVSIAETLNQSAQTGKTVQVK